MGKPLSFTLRVHRAVAESSMPSSARHVVHVLAVYANSATGTGWHSQATIARLTGLGERTVRAAMADLASRRDWPVRLVRRRRGAAGGIGRSSDEWRLQLTTEPAPVAASDPPPPAAIAASDGGTAMTRTGKSGDPNRQNLQAEPATIAGDLTDRSHGSISRSTDAASTSEAVPALVLVPSPTQKRAAKLRRPKKTDQEQGPKHAKVVAHYFEVFQRQRGSKPVGFDGADGKAVSKLLQKCKGDPDEACKVITGAFASWKGHTVTIRQIASNPSEFVGGSPSRRNGPVQPNHGVLDRSKYSDETPAERRTREQLERVEMLEAQERDDAQRAGGR